LKATGSEEPIFRTGYPISQWIKYGDERNPIIEEVSEEERLAKIKELFKHLDPYTAQKYSGFIDKMIREGKDVATILANVNFRYRGYR
jgi:hypothetical protein